MQVIDEDLHSRQLAVYGRETMRRLFASNVLISGLQGLGAEIAKNLILAGVKSVTLHDEESVELWDLSSNFTLSEDDVGKNRAAASLHKLQELNKAVHVSTFPAKLSKEQLSNFQVVVFTNIDLKTVDVDGEEPHNGIILSIGNNNPALVTCVGDERLEFQDNDLVTFSEIHGMTELNDGKLRKVRGCTPYSFFLEEDTANFGTYVKGGIVTEVKQPKVLNFKPLGDALKTPGEFLLGDFSKLDRPPLLHLAFQALDKFISELGRFPVAGSEGDAQKLISIATSMNESLGDEKLDYLNPKLLRDFAYGARAVLNPMAAMFGGIVAQEVVKACSGKFHPLLQFFYFDSVESLPTKPLEPSEYMPLNSRYDAQISVFGAKFQKKLESTKSFVIGSGALGCELLKNLALMGVSCGTQGKLTLTDDDVIKKSNLCQQFLFRDWNIGQAKSTIAASAAALINPNIRIEALQNRVGLQTENVIDDTFWENLNVVINALDSVEARRYVDNRCLYFQKPLLESGTLGAKCHTQMVIPHLTENYGASMDPPDKRASMVTIHSFPRNIEHCLTWARSEFEELLNSTPAEVNAYLLNPGEYASTMRNKGDTQACKNLERIFECLDNKEKCETFQDCISWARLKFEDYFSNRVKQLISTFPAESTYSEGATGTRAPFWSAPKRFPFSLEFSVSDPSHLSFVMAGSILRAETFGISIPDWAKNSKKLAQAVGQICIPDFHPKQVIRKSLPLGAAISIPDCVKSSMKLAVAAAPARISDFPPNQPLIESPSIGAAIEGLIEKIERRMFLPSGYTMMPIAFEKDDDTNYHMDFIAGLANLRARNYSIPEVDKLKAKIIAGNIIPSIATSTTMATGLVCLELYKVIDGGHKVQDYRNTFANLALPFLSMAEPVPPKVMKHRHMKWTVWDKWTIEGNPTVRELIKWLAEKGLYAHTFFLRSCLLYTDIMPNHKDRMDRKVVDLARDVCKMGIPPCRRHLDLIAVCQDEDENDIDIPCLSVNLS
uniref:ubiquitin-activating enzyme E1 1-like isoform X2 n=1 Tax=Erigeron canadensis TaxID=72917 RepID=UPI001CB94577|nr:ubiquitin-activating enzyme E1 1-like isoform X2 [Erigeron canadensis]